MKGREAMMILDIGFSKRRLEMKRLIPTGGVSGIMIGFILLAQTPLGLVSLAMGVVYLLSAWILVYSDHVKAFLARQRGAGKKPS